MKRVFDNYKLARVVANLPGPGYVDNVVGRYNDKYGFTKKGYNSKAVGDAFTLIHQAEDDGYIELDDRLEFIRKRLELTPKGRRLVHKEFGIPLNMINTALKENSAILNLLFFLISVGALVAFFKAVQFLVRYLFTL